MTNPIHEPIAELRKVTKMFGGKKAVNQVSFTIEKGSITAILGPNGAGKSTAISMMLGLKDASEGKVLLFGQSPKDLKVREKIGAMLQEVSVMDGLRTREIINLIRGYYPNPLSLDDIALLSGLTPEELNKWAVKMSGGQKRKLSFALAIAGNPELLFFDEPTVGLDTSARRLFWQTVRKLADQGKTILFTTHYLQEADDMADRILLFHQGQVAADGTPEAIKAKLTRRSVSFIVDADHRQVKELLREVPGVTDVFENNGRLNAVTDDTDTALAALFRAGLAVRDVRIDQGSLDEAFDQLTMDQGRPYNHDNLETDYLTMQNGIASDGTQSVLYFLVAGDADPVLFHFYPRREYGGGRCRTMAGALSHVDGILQRHGDRHHVPRHTTRSGTSTGLGRIHACNAASRQRVLLRQNVCADGYASALHHRDFRSRLPD